MALQRKWQDCETWTGLARECFWGVVYAAAGVTASMLLHAWWAA